MAGSGLGLRTERVRIYRRTDEGADGFQRPVFVFEAERWGRIAVATATFRLAPTPQAAYDVRFDATATFHDEVSLPTDGLLLARGVAYFLRGEVESTLLRRRTVRLERISADTFARFFLYEGEPVLDGAHIVDPKVFGVGEAASDPGGVDAAGTMTTTRASSL